MVSPSTTAAAPVDTAGLALACTECHGALERDEAGDFTCTACGAEFPRRAEVDVFLNAEEWADLVSTLEDRKDIYHNYHVARREAALNVMYFDWFCQFMLDQIPPDNDGPLVELMCGEAEIARRLPARFKSVMALDLNVRMVEQAARDLAAQSRQVLCVAGTVARLPLPDESVGAVIVQSALHHAKPILHDVFAEVHRVLRPGGVFVGSEPANDHWFVRRLRHWQYARSPAQGNDPGEDGFTRAEFEDVLSASNLRLDRYRRFGFLAFPLMGNTQLFPLLAKSRSRALGRVLMALDTFFRYVPIARGFALQSIFRAFKDPT